MSENSLEIETKYYEHEVLTLANAIVKEVPVYLDCDQYSYYWCEYCNVTHADSKNFEHDAKCPVLVAKDVLTRYEARTHSTGD